MQWTDKDFAAFRNGVCVAISTVMEGKGADRHNKEFYRDYAGCEIKIMPRAEACAALKESIEKPRTQEVAAN